MSPAKPTPTQAECDAHARGEHIDVHEDDGSEIQHHAHPHEERELLSKPKVEASSSSGEAEKVADTEKAVEAEGDRHEYKTRDTKASRVRQGTSVKSDDDKKEF